VSSLWDDVLNDVKGDSVFSQLNAIDQAGFVDFHPDRKRFSYQLPDRVITITLRERETLEFIVTGLTVRQTALKMSLSHRTVEFYVKTLRYKFKCASKRDLICFVLQKKVLDALVVSYY
jgi:DNA-binding CsgD family transcriptional regulator